MQATNLRETRATAPIASGGRPGWLPNWRARSPSIVGFLPEDKLTPAAS